jgi:hypothetical protein
MRVTRILAAALVLGAVLFMLVGPRKSRAQLAHNPGQICSSCHHDYRLAGTVFADKSASRGQAGVGVSAVGEDGIEIPVGSTDSSGNLAAGSSPAGLFLIRVGNIMSRTWHALPGQGICNGCHARDGNPSALSTRTLPELHTRIPSDNNCAHCHHFPASMSYAMLATTGVLAVAPPPAAAPVSQVDFLGRVCTFDPFHRTV